MASGSGAQIAVDVLRRGQLRTFKVTPLERKAAPAKVINSVRTAAGLSGDDGIETIASRLLWEAAMAASENPSVFELAIEAWRYTFAALSRMPSILGIAMAIVFGLSIATLPLLPDPNEEPGLIFHLFGFLISIAQAYFLTPVAIAVHRFVLLGEVTERYAPNPSDPRFMRFFVFSVVYHLLTSVPAC